MREEGGVAAGGEGINRWAESLSLGLSDLIQSLGQSLGCKTEVTCGSARSVCDRDEDQTEEERNRLPFYGRSDHVGLAYVNQSNFFSVIYSFNRVTSLLFFFVFLFFFFSPSLLLVSFLFPPSLLHKPILLYLTTLASLPYMSERAVAPAFFISPPLRLPPKFITAFFSSLACCVYVSRLASRLSIVRPFVSQGFFLRRHPLV